MRHSTPHRVAHDARDRTTRAYGTMSALIDATNKVRAPRARARVDASANEKCLFTFQRSTRVCSRAPRDTDDVIARDARTHRRRRRRRADDRREARRNARVTEGRNRTMVRGMNAARAAAPRASFRARATRTRRRIALRRRRSLGGRLAEFRCRRRRMSRRRRRRAGRRR